MKTRVKNAAKMPFDFGSGCLLRHRLAFQVAYTIKFLKLSHDNGTARFKKFKQLFENQHLLLLRDICCSEL
jgi:hypothetical protein